MNEITKSIRNARPLHLPKAGFEWGGSKLGSFEDTEGPEAGRL